MITKLKLGKKISKKDLEKEGFQVSSYAEDILSKVKFGKKREVEIVIKSVSELGLSDYSTTKQIFDKAKELGYELCPAEVGPALRMAYKDQPINDYFWIAMEPIMDRDGDPDVFHVERSAGEAWLSADRAHPDGTWSSYYRFAFVMPRKFGKLELSAIGPLEARLKELEKDMAKIKKLINI